MSNEQNWVEATSAAEMSAVAAFMAGARETFPKQVSAHAINSYTNCNRPKLAIKCALITLEAVRAVGAHVDAAKDYLKFVNIKNTRLISHKSVIMVNFNFSQKMMITNKDCSFTCGTISDEHTKRFLSLNLKLL